MEHDDTSVRVTPAPAPLPSSPVAASLSLHKSLSACDPAGSIAMSKAALADAVAGLATTAQLAALGRYIQRDLLPRLDAPCIRCNELSGTIAALEVRLANLEATAAQAFHKTRPLKLLWKHGRVIAGEDNAPVTIAWDAATSETSSVEWPAVMREIDNGVDSDGSEHVTTASLSTSTFHDRSSLRIRRGGLYELDLAVWAPKSSVTAVLVLLDGAPMLRMPLLPRYDGHTEQPDEKESGMCTSPCADRSRLVQGAGVVSELPLDATNRDRDGEARELEMGGPGHAPIESNNLSSDAVVGLGAPGREPIESNHNDDVVSAGVGEPVTTSGEILVIDASDGVRTHDGACGYDEATYAGGVPLLTTPPERIDKDDDARIGGSDRLVAVSAVDGGLVFERTDATARPHCAAGDGPQLTDGTRAGVPSAARGAAYRQHSASDADGAVTAPRHPRGAVVSTCTRQLVALPVGGTLTVALENADLVCECSPPGVIRTGLERRCVRRGVAVCVGRLQAFLQITKT